MNCDEFLMQFRDALEGKVPQQLIQDNLNYYREYIDGRIRNGENEQEVLRMLGDPRLLAKTIQESSKFGTLGGEEQNQKDVYEYDGVNDKIKKLPGFLIACITIVGILLLVVVVFRVFVFFMPTIAVMVIIGIIYKAVVNRHGKY